MLNPYSRDNIDAWVGDFCGSPRYAALPHAAKEYASQILVSFLVRACEDDDIEPGNLSEKELRCGLLKGVAPLDLPESVTAEVPLLCRSFLEELEDQGRLGGGADLGRYVGALRQTYLEAAGILSAMRAGVDPLTTLSDEAHLQRTCGHDGVP